MFTLLPPIGELDVHGTTRFNGSCMNEIQNAEMCDADVLFVAKPQQPRPPCPDDQLMVAVSPVTSNDGLNSERGFVDIERYSAGDKTESVQLSLSHGESQLTSWTSCHAYEETARGMLESSSLEKSETGREPDCERTAERPIDYEPGQPQKLSFENELTFIPKLNALSLKIAQSRTSIAQRIKVSCESRAAALDKEMAQNFTFRPSISENSLKIADRLKTDFWARQKLHTERQKKMLNAAPSTWHPKTKSNSTAKHALSLAESSSKETTATEQPSQIKDDNTTWNYGAKQEHMEKNSPYTKSVDNVLFKERKTRFKDTSPQRLERLKTKPLKRLEQKTIQTEKLQCSVDTDFLCGSKSEPSSPRKSHIYRIQGTSKSVEAGMMEHADQNEKGNNISKGVHKRCKTLPSNQIHKVHQPLTIDPDRFLKTKHAADQALRSKKVFICMGPYPVLRACLRRRGWIEKNFKADIACSNSAQKRSPDNIGRDSDDDYDDADEADSPCDDRKGGSAKARETTHTEKNNSMKSKRWGFGRNEAPGFAAKSSIEKNNLETKSRYAYGTTTVGNFDDLDQGFESDSQYGIMSRIARNAVPTLIWTCRRSDIEFNFLTKDQIVNHFVHVSSFTTKFGLCMNIRNLPWFENVDPDSFFPRCHRLSSDIEKQDFIDEYRILSAIGIISHTVMRFSPSGQSEGTNSKDKILTPQALLLAMKACQGYLRSQEHFDIEADGQEIGEQLYGLSDEKWNQLIEFFYQITHYNGIIMSAETYLNECRELLKKMEKTYPQVALNNKNIWIVKPGAKSRGRGIMVMDNLEEILKLSSSSMLKKENKWVVQKYIERPLLVYNTKFDIRQWFLVTDWNPLTLWFYKDCYLRFCSQEFTLKKFDPKYHLANNSIQKDYSNGPRSKHLPDDNMWTKDQYILYLRNHGYGEFWDEIIYPTMKRSIIYTLQACQDSLEYRKNSFELFGADFMLSEDLKPWLIEINCSPAMGPSTAITEKLCAEVIEDTLKVVLDRKENKSCDTGKFELAFKQQYIPIPVYTGNSLTVEGEGCKKPPQQTNFPPHNLFKNIRHTKVKEPKENKEVQTSPEKSVSLFKMPSPPTKKKSNDTPPDILGHRNEHIACSNILKKEIQKLIFSEKKADSWHGCLCGKGEQCQIVAGYHVTNASLDITIPCLTEKKKGRSNVSSQDSIVPARLTKQSLKLARMHRKARKKIAHATLKYHRSTDGPGLSIAPGNGVTQF